jgi:hypothetical protein
METITSVEVRAASASASASTLETVTAKVIEGGVGRKFVAVQLEATKSAGWFFPPKCETSSFL